VTTKKIEPANVDDTNSLVMASDSMRHAPLLFPTAFWDETSQKFSLNKFFRVQATLFITSQSQSVSLVIADEPIQIIGKIA